LKIRAPPFNKLVKKIDSTPLINTFLNLTPLPESHIPGIKVWTRKKKTRCGDRLNRLT